MNSHFKNFRKAKTGKIGVWGIKNKKTMEEVWEKNKTGRQLTDVKNV